MKGFGFGFSITRPVFGSGGVRPVAPVLTRTSADSDNTPNFSVLLVAPLSGDVVELQVSDVVDFSSLFDMTDIGVVFDNPVLISTSLLANGVWYARAKVTRSGVDSAWSNIVTFTIHVAGEPIGLLLALTKAA